ncbi:MAG: Uma2 family endonuclease [Mycobacteriales bacterium]
MNSMTVMPRGDNWTVADLAAIPDDGLQYELADGVLLVSPAPRPRHQVVVGELYLLLRAACPADLQVFLAPLDYQPTNRRSFQPDLLVVRRTDVGESNVVAPLLLAVEVLSPSTRSKDLLLKRGLYEESGVGSYWIVDLDEPSVTVLELRDGRYVEAGAVVGNEVLALDLPFPVRLCPQALLG